MNQAVVELMSELRGWGAPVLAIVFALALLRVKNRILRDLEERGHVPASMAGRFRVIGRWIVLGTLLLFLSQYLGVSEHIWAFASAALAAVAVGVVAIWSILSNALAALLILVYRPFRFGYRSSARARWNRGVRGRVMDMNLMFTALMQKDEAGDMLALVHMPNNLVFQKLVRVYCTAQQITPFFAGKLSDSPGPRKE